MRRQVIKIAIILVVGFGCLALNSGCQSVGVVVEEEPTYRPGPQLLRKNQLIVLAHLKKQVLPTDTVLLHGLRLTATGRNTGITTIHLPMSIMIWGVNYTFITMEGTGKYRCLFQQGFILT
jgi:hypothetical protein